jgi:hypothetical protein
MGSAASRVHQQAAELVAEVELVALVESVLLDEELELPELLAEELELDVELAVKRAVTAVLAPCGLEAVKAPLGPESAWGCCSSSS